MTPAEKKARDAVVRTTMKSYLYDTLHNPSWNGHHASELERAQNKACERLLREEARRKGVRRAKK